MKQKALSFDGYIIDQRQTDDISYGVKMSDYNGCGWIAVYNFLKTIGIKCEYLQVRNEMQKGLWLGGRLGTGPFRLRRILRAKGIVLRTTYRKGSTVKAAGQSKVGILLYLTEEGAHYVVFQNRGNGKLRFLNAIEGDNNHITTMKNFLEQYSKFPLVVALCYVERKTGTAHKL